MKSMEIARDIPRLVVLELTRRCSLNCLHCRAESRQDFASGELKTQDWIRILDEIASVSKPIIIFSGGEALLREDVFELISYAKNKGLTPVIATCGLPLTVEIAKELKEAGIKRVSISLDGKDAATHDSFRGEKGAFEKALLAMKILQDKNLEFQINTTVTKLNLSQLEDIFNLAMQYGAVSFHPFFLVPVGRASRIKDLQLSGYEYEEALTKLYAKSKTSVISCRPTCAPHYSRILGVKTAGCLCARSFCFVSSEGKVYPCGFLELECGDLKEDNFTHIWQGSAIFNRLRDYRLYKGKCGECEYLNICSGCRARAFAESQDYLEEEPYCVYQPSTVRL